MKSLPLLNGRTANPSETSKRPVALSIMGSSSTRQTISGEGSSLGVMHICATALFPMWDVAIMPHNRPRQVGRVVDLSLMDLSLMRACGPPELACLNDDSRRLHVLPCPTGRAAESASGGLLDPLALRYTTFAILPLLVQTRGRLPAVAEAI